MSESEGSVAAVVEEEVNDLASAVRRVCKNALAVDGLARGLHEGRSSIFWEVVKQGVHGAREGSFRRRTGGRESCCEGLRGECVRVRGGKYSS